MTSHATVDELPRIEELPRAALHPPSAKGDIH
jgi:hypothetical protein